MVISIYCYIVNYDANLFVLLKITYRKDIQWNVAPLPKGNFQDAHNESQFFDFQNSSCNYWKKNQIKLYLRKIYNMWIKLYTQ